MGWKSQIITVPRDRSPDHLAADVNTDQHLLTDTARIRQALGYTEKASRDEALRRTVDWERAHPPDEIDPKQFDYGAQDDVLAQVKR